MLTPILVGVVAMAALVLLDRVLLRLEARGWIHYRRRGLSKGGAAYHVLQFQSIFNPGAKQVIEVKYREERDEDDSGDTR